MTGRVFVSWSNFGKLCIIMMLSAMVNVHAADALRTSLFSDTEKVMQQAKDSQAPLLAPVSYEEAMDAYNKAEKRYQKKQKVEKIKNDLANATTYFYKAIESTNLARITFKSAIKARGDAEGVEANTLASEEWERAEKQFNDAAEALETGSLSTANKKAEEAEKTYREAELIAIKHNYLSKTRDIIDQAKKEKVYKYAPLTLDRAEDLLKKAEHELTVNRYDTDYPRSLAKQSLYEAKHSIFLAGYVKQIRKDDVTLEQLILDLEKPLIEVSESMDIVAEFDQGFAEPTKKAKGKVDLLMMQAQELSQVKLKMAELEKDYGGLERRLGIQSQRIAKQEEQQAKIAKINRLFHAEEAVVLMQGDNIIIRAVGLSFSPGSSKVNTGNIRLLKKLEQVFDIFKGYDVVVEGHTDSFGGDSANLTLSYDRANAIREYFSVNMPNFPSAHSSAKGYGETQPIANNETAAGRKKNRRIDLVFIPTM
ncbi:Outer membrane porin F [Thalassocella blandensis]|nr:Outer membrane porin F [Thalassocella blandensis]